MPGAEIREEQGNVPAGYRKDGAGWGRVLYFGQGV